MTRLRGDGGGARSHHLSAAPNNSSVLLRLTSQPEFFTRAPVRAAARRGESLQVYYSCDETKRDLLAVNALAR